MTGDVFGENEGGRDRSRAEFNATPEGRALIVDAQQKAEMRRMRGVMQITTDMLKRAIRVIEESAPHRLAEFPAPDEDAIARAAVQAERNLRGGKDAFRAPFPEVAAPIRTAKRNAKRKRRPSSKVRTRTKSRSAKKKARRSRS